MLEDTLEMGVNLPKSAAIQLELIVFGVIFDSGQSIAGSLLMIGLFGRITTLI